MNWNDINYSNVENSNYSYDKIEKKSVNSNIDLSGLTEKDIVELNKVEYKISFHWAIGEWLTWRPLQYFVMTITMLVLLIVSTY